MAIPGNAWNFRAAANIIPLPRQSGSREEWFHEAIFASRICGLRFCIGSDPACIGNAVRQAGNADQKYG
jgi:hypothetical protein